SCGRPGPTRSSSWSPSRTTPRLLASDRQKLAAKHVLVRAGHDPPALVRVERHPAARALVAHEVVDDPRVRVAEEVPELVGEDLGSGGRDQDDVVRAARA